MNKMQVVLLIFLVFFSSTLVEARSMRCKLKVSRKSSKCKKYAGVNKNEVFLLVSQHPNRIILCRGRYQLAKYKIGYGRRGFGKQREGDKKTPIGSYKILWMAARHEPRRPARLEKRLQRFQIRDRAAWCKADPKTKVSLFRRKQGPRDERLWRKPYGGRFAMVMGINYPNKADRAAGKTGSCIEIHTSFHRKASAGCVILYPKDMRTIYNCVAPNTRVEIRRKL